MSTERIVETGLLSLVILEERAGEQECRMENQIQDTETNVAQRLARAIRGRRTMTLCYLTYETSEQRERLAAQVAEELGGREQVSLHDLREASTQGLVELLGGPEGAPPLQVTDPGAWPGGARNFGEILSLSRDRMAKECARPLLFWGTTAEINQVLRGGGDLHSWSSGTFDFAASDRKPVQTGGDPEIPVPSAGPASGQPGGSGPARARAEWSETAAPASP